jgi:hypothetical protein
MAMNGQITGKGPKDKDERAALLATGWLPYSFKTTNEKGEVTYTSFERSDPYGMFFGLVADAAEMRSHVDDDTFEDWACAAVGALANNLTSKTYLRGVTEILDAVNNPEQKGSKFIQNRLASYMPSAAKQIGGLVHEDPYMREVRSVMDAIKARTPGWSDTLPPKRNVLGQPIKYPPGYGPDSISPFSYSKELSDPVKQELAKFEKGFGLPPEKVGNVDLTKYTTKSGQQAYDRLVELRNVKINNRDTLAEALEKLITSDKYKRLPDGNDEYSSRKLTLIRAEFGKYSEMALKQLQKEIPALAEDLKTDKNNKKVVQRKGVEAASPLDALQSLLQPK